MSNGFRPAQRRRDSKGRFVAAKPKKKPGFLRRLLRK